MTKPSADQVTRVLLNMGTDAHAVARTLEHAGVRGVDGYSFTYDPICNYLKKLFPGTYVEVTEPLIYIEADPGIDTPPAVRAFMEAFDRGEHRHLLAEKVSLGGRAAPLRDKEQPTWADDMLDETA